MDLHGRRSRREALTDMFIESNLPEDPVFRDHVLGWVVFREAPWRIQGIYSSKERAKEEASQSGDEYQVIYASHWLGSQEIKPRTPL